MTNDESGFLIGLILGAGMTAIICLFTCSAPDSEIKRAQHETVFSERCACHGGHVIRVNNEDECAQWTPVKVFESEDSK